ncbi:hypothetical protein [Deinococcus aestuarii]|nr:hypothetical protein [Deinococcus aestuarii]
MRDAGVKLLAASLQPTSFNLMNWPQRDTTRKGQARLAVDLAGW